MGYQKIRSPVRSPSGEYSTAGGVDTGKVWHDGSPILRKVVDMGALLDTGSKQVAHGITGLARVISLSAIAVNATPTWRHVPYVTGTAIDSLTLEINATVVAIISYADWTDHTAQVVIEYTVS